MEILFLILNLLIYTPAESSQNQVSGQNETTTKTVNVGNTIVDDLNGLIR